MLENAAGNGNIDTRLKLSEVKGEGKKI